MNSSRPPAVSVIMGAYNAEPYVGAAIESILSQDFDDFEFLIADDGSTDRTVELAEGFAVRDSRVRILRGRHRGRSVTLNMLLKEAKAPLIAQADADDIYRPTRFAKQVRFLEANPHFGAVGSEVDMIDAGGNPISRPSGYKPRPQDHDDIVRELLDHVTAIAHPTLMMRREFVLQVGGYHEAFDLAMDYELLLRLCGVTKLANLTESLVEYRRHPRQLTATFKPRQIRNVAIARLAHDARLAGRVDPIEGLKVLPETAELDAIFGPSSTARAYDLIFKRIRGLGQLTGDGWEAALRHARASPDLKTVWTAARLLRASQVRRASQLCIALLNGIVWAPWQRAQRSRS